MKKEEYAAYLIFIAFATYVTAVNVKGIYIIHFIDQTWPLNPAQDIVTLLYAWKVKNMGGSQILNIFNLPDIGWPLLLSLFRIPPAFGDIFTYILSQSLASIFFYKIMRKFIIPSEKKIIWIAAIVASLLFVYNYDILINYWWDATSIDFLFSGLFIAFIYYLMIELQSFIRGNRINYPRFAGLLILSELTFSINVPANFSYAVLTLALPGLLLFYPAFTFKGLRRFIIFYAIFLAAALAINTWWIGSTILFSRLAPAFAGSSTSVNYNLLLFIQTTRPLNLITLLRGMYGIERYPGATAADTFIYSSFGSYLTYLIPISIAIAYFGRRRYNVQYLYFLIVSILLAIVMAGVNSPVYFLVKILVSNPLILQAIRNVPVAFGYSFYTLLIILLSVSVVRILLLLDPTSRFNTSDSGSKSFRRLSRQIPAIPESVSYIRPAGYLWKNALPEAKWKLARASDIPEVVYTKSYRNLKDLQVSVRHRMLNNRQADYYATAVRTYSGRRKYLGQSFALLLIFLLIAAPFVSTATPIFTGHAIPGSPYRARMSIPPYEYAVASYLKTHVGNAYALLYPGGFLEQNWTNGYDSYDVLPSLLPASMIIDGKSNQVLNFIYNSIGSGSAAGENLSLALAQLNVQYVVIEGMVGGNVPFGFGPPPDYPLILSSLNHTANLTLAKVISPDYIYRNALLPGTVSIASRIINGSGFLDGYAVPAENIGSSYFNDSLVNPITTVSQTLENRSLFGTHFLDSVNMTSGYLSSSRVDPALSVSQIVDNNTFFGSNFKDYSNITGLVYSSSQENSSFVAANDFSAQWNGGISISLNNSTKAYIQSHPVSGPLGSMGVVFYNGLPLQINTSVYPYLVMNFSTNINTAIYIQLFTAPVINSTTWNNNRFQVALYEYWASNGVYGAFRYSSPGHSSMLLVNMNNALSRSRDKTVDYILIQILPLNNTGAGLHASISDWPGYQNLTISYLAIGKFYTSTLQPGTYISTPTQNIQTQNGIVTYDIVSPVDVHVNVGGLNGTLPVLVVFHQNYNPYWMLENTKGISSWKHVLIDNSMNGYLIYPVNGSNGISFDMKYTVQSYVYWIVYLPLSFNVLLIGVIIFSKSSRTRLRSLVDRLAKHSKVDGKT
ncbi:MAG: hypothetical protein KIS29_08150 [Thermoplasmata archaeon]|nr:hypothetical protein [Candidatus Sysuiplasma jiujiangense]